MDQSTARNCDINNRTRLIKQVNHSNHFNIVGIEATEINDNMYHIEVGYRYLKSIAIYITFKVVTVV